MQEPWLPAAPSRGRLGHRRGTPEPIMLNLKTTYAIERAVATGQAVRLD